MTEVVLVVPDLQTPFHHPDALDFCSAVHSSMRCTEVVNIGDEIDFYALSRYPRIPEAHSHNTEFELATKELKRWFTKFPRTKVCISNHTWRPYRNAQDYNIPEIFLRKISSVLNAPKGWQWANEWEIDGITYEHGHKLSSRVETAWTQRLRSTVHGHTHTRFGVRYFRAANTRGFVASAGCLIDEDAYAFRYSSAKDIQLGCMVVEGAVPIPIPMNLDKHKRWTGKLTL